MKLCNYILTPDGITLTITGEFRETATKYIARGTFKIEDPRIPDVCTVKNPSAKKDDIGKISRYLSIELTERDDEKAKSIFGEIPEDVIKRSNFGITLAEMLEKPVIVYERKLVPVERKVS